MPHILEQSEQRSCHNRILVTVLLDLYYVQIDRKSTNVEPWLGYKLFTEIWV